jgi:hypothetical protein
VRLSGTRHAGNVRSSARCRDCDRRTGLLGASAGRPSAVAAGYSRPWHCDGARRLLASSARRRPSHRSLELYAGRRCHRRAENRLCAIERRCGGRLRACPIHADGGARLHAAPFLGSAWLGDRGSGSGHTLHWPQPGDDRCAAVMEHRRLLRLRRASLRAECSEIARIDSPDFRVSRRCSETGAARG